MAAIDERVLTLIEELSRSQAQHLGDIAQARLDAAERGAGSGDDEERDPFARSPGESDAARARRQLECIAFTIRTLLKREVLLLDRSRELASEFAASSRQPDARWEAFKVIVVPTDGDEENLSRTPEQIDLLSEARRDALSEMIAAWEEAVEAARREIDEAGDAEG
ncbi:hypothetical protein [Sphingopyxis fribergensis]